MTTPEQSVSPAEYLARERASETRSEYFQGRVYAMTGASSQHGRITVNLAAALCKQLRGGPCEAFVTDLRVLVRANGLYTYPDLVVACRDARYEDAHFDTLMDPTVILEILSPSTESYDRGRKFALYRELDTLREYVLVAQDRPHVECFTRDGDRWTLTESVGLDATLGLASAGVTLSLRDLYERVEWPETPPLRVVREPAAVG